MASAPTDRRQSKRYALHLDLEYRVFGKGHSIVTGTTTTINISSSGLLLAQTAGVIKGQLVELSIRWRPGAHGVPGVTLEVLGRVLRLDEGGTAIRILRYGFNIREGPASGPLS
jgi:hypothetical protein